MILSDAKYVEEEEIDRYRRCRCFPDFVFRLSFGFQRLIRLERPKRNALF